MLVSKDNLPGRYRIIFQEAACIYLSITISMKWLHILIMFSKINIVHNQNVSIVFETILPFKMLNFTNQIYLTISL